MLQNDAAVFRTQETLENGCKDIDDCVASFEDVGIQDRSMVWNTDLCETLELENLLTNAAVTMHSAEARKVRCVYTAKDDESQTCNLNVHECLITSSMSCHKLYVLLSCCCICVPLGRTLAVSSIPNLHGLFTWLSQLDM